MIEQINDESIFLDLDKIKFNKVLNISKNEFNGKVYDLEIDSIPNYKTVVGFAHNGGGKRKGSAAIYVAPHHADIFDFLDLRKNNGKEELRARDLNLAIWAPDLFFKKVKADEDWYLMDPNVSQGLEEVYDETPEGGSFTDLYTKYVSEGKFVKKVKAREVWGAIITSQIETGQPYVLAKDSANRKSNQKNLGTIKSSNLCAEIIEYSNPEETAVCFTADTKILTKNGYKNIVDCEGEEIFSPFESDTIFNKINKYQKANLISNGVKEVFEINTSSGASIKATANHLFLVRDSTKYNKLNERTDFYSWKKLSDLKVGDKISFETNCADKNLIFNKKDIDWLSAGWMMGDGWCSKNGWGVCFGPNEQIASSVVINHLSEVHQSLEVIGNGKNTVVNAYVQPNGVINWQSSKTNFKKYYQDKFGFETKLGKEKFLSSKVLQSSKLELCSFLSGLFSADGTFGNYNGKAYVGLSSASKELLNTVSLALASLGIRARFTFGPDKRKENKYQGHLNIHGVDQLILYKNMIGFDLSDDKQNLLNSFIEDNVNKSGKNNTGLYNFHTVKSVSFVGKEMVYDLSLKEQHNFVANNMVVHNCNLASVSLPAYVEGKKGRRTFNFDRLRETVKTLTQNLNKIIDVEYYPVETAKTSNFKHRPIGIGVQGLADVFALMRFPWESPEALQLNKDIMEAMYYSAVKTSCELAKEHKPYSTFKGSPAAEGILQFDLWGVEPSEKYDWQQLREDVKKHGLRNSLLLTAMPTASTSQILGNTESFEMITSNIYKRATLSGEFIQVNKYLVEDLLESDLWNDTMRQKITAAEGSIQNIPEIPESLKLLYKTVWETSQKVVLQMAAARGPFICQSQSMNLYFQNANSAKISSALMYAWELGLKTLVYYTRNTGAMEAGKFTIDKNIEKEISKSSNQTSVKDEMENIEEGVACSLDNPEACEMCSG